MEEAKDTIATSSTSSLHLSTNPKPKKPPPKRFIKSQIPPSLLSDPALLAAISLLPSHYNFEIPKTLHRISTLPSPPRRVALQLPDGLLLFSLPLADILRSFSPSRPDVLLLSEPTYGACCLDDFAAKSLDADLLVHYGHSCLFPVPSSLLPTLYVFVDISIDPSRLVSSIKSNFPPSSPIALAGTVQFISAVHAAKSMLSEEGYEIIVPQSKPLSAGEVLGCTAPAIPKSKKVETLVFVADGRFHLEALMIANPGIKAFRYDPYIGVLVLEEYDYEGMKKARKDAILRAREARNWGVILGTLGRQGSLKVLDRVLGKMEEKGLEYTVVMMSEISPGRIELFGDEVDAWVQIACPRLSIDWGEGFGRPMLTTFELEVALGYVKGWWEKERRGEEKGLNGGCCGGGGRCCLGLKGCASGSCGCVDNDAEPDYPMDYYAQDGGDWNGSYVKKKLATNGTQNQSCRGSESVS